MNTRHGNGSEDIVSMVVFDDYADIVFERESYNDINGLIQTMLQYPPRNYTRFDQGLELGQQVIQRQQQSSGDHLPIFIFLSDGFDQGNQRTFDVMQTIKNNNSNIKIFTIKFGNDSGGVDTLQRLVSSYF